MKITVLILLCLGLAGCASPRGIGAVLGTGIASYQQAKIDAAVDARLGGRSYGYGYGYRPVVVYGGRYRGGRRWR